MVFLGIELDSIEMSARLPADKLADLIALLREWGNKKSCRPKKLQSLLGKLNHVMALDKTEFAAMFHLILMGWGIM